MASSTQQKRVARGWQRKKANRDTYEEILEAAAKAFATKGYEGASLAEIAKEVGIKTPALYYHFKSKNEILYAYLVRCADRTTGPIRAAIAQAGDDPVARLRAFVTTYIRVQLEFAPTMPIINTVIFSSSLSNALTRSQQKWVRDWERDIVGMVREVLSEGKEAGVFSFTNLAPTAFFVMGSIDFVVNWYRPDGESSIEEIADEYSDLIQSALKTAG